MSRKSVEARATLVVHEGFGERPAAPSNLNAAAAEVWKRTVASEAGPFFGTAALRTMLADYCRHVAAADVLSAQIDAFDEALLDRQEGLKRYDLLLKARDRETKAAADKATKLRLTNQARYTPAAAATAARRAGGETRKPWEG